MGKVMSMVKLVIKNVHIVDVDREQIERGAVAISDSGWITQVWTGSQVPDNAGAEVIDGHGGYLMPGLIDAHVHLRSGAAATRDADNKWTPVEYMARALVNARHTIDAGITSVRDAGSSFGIGVGVRRAVDLGWHVGPHVRAAGEPFSITGGHGDPQNGWPDHVRWNTGTVVDSPEEARRAARRQARAKVDWLKFMASGGVSSVGDKSTDRGLPESDMRAAVEEARNVGIRTMAHAQAEVGIDNAIRAGVDSIEHGFYPSDWAIDTMAKNHIALVPTLSAMVQILAHPDEVAPSTLDKAKVARDAHFSAVLRAYRAGVPIVMGTDAGTPFNQHGENGQELLYLHEAGLSTWDTLKAATSGAAELLDLPTGRIGTDHWADLLLVDANPYEDLRVLTRSEHRVAVFWQGRRLR